MRPSFLALPAVAGALCLAMISASGVVNAPVASPASMAAAGNLLEPHASMVAADNVLDPAYPSAVRFVGAHPVDAQGFVLDGSPQLDDAHCVGTPFDVFVCLTARHPDFPAFLMAHAAPDPATVPCGEAVARWWPQVAQYDWPVMEMLKIMCRESRGDPFARNKWSGACGLFQDLPAYPDCTDGFTNIAYSYNEKYRAGGLGPWRATS